MSNIARQMEEQLRRAELDLLRRASEVAADHEVGLYLVGGTVRDILSGTRPADLDLVATDSAPEFPTTLAEGLGGDVVARSQFGTAKLKVDGVEIDLASARRESYASPGALPEVEQGTIDDDLARRDFSINAMAASLADESWGELLDPFGGRADLEAGQVRVLREDSFADDATRILRALRYAHRAGFALDVETERLLGRDLGRLDTISGDRLRQELSRMLREPRVARVLGAAQALGVLAAVHPALRAEPASLSRLEEAQAAPEPQSELRVLAVLVASSSAEERASVMGRLNMDGSWAGVVRDVSAVAEAAGRLGGPDIRHSAVFDLLRRLDAEAIEGYAIAADDALVRERLELYLTELRHVRTLLDGNDLMAMGVPEGPMVGKLLDELLKARIEGLLSSREDEESYVRRSLGG